MSADPYYSRTECSNSDLSELKKLLMPAQYEFDYSDALRMGTLVDAFITEIEKVNVYKRTIEEYSYTEAEMQLARDMKRSFYKDQTCAAFMKLAECQKVSVKEVEFEYCGTKFKILMRCRWDLFMKSLKMGADIKSTTATTQKQFEEACLYFDYYRSRVIYMLLEGTSKDMLIGISKINKKIFKIPIVMGDEKWQLGLKSATEFAFQYWLNFENFTI